MAGLLFGSFHTGQVLAVNVYVLNFLRFHAIIRLKYGLRFGRGYVQFEYQRFLSHCHVMYFLEPVVPLCNTQIPENDVLNVGIDEALAYLVFLKHLQNGPCLVERHVTAGKFALSKHVGHAGIVQEQKRTGVVTFHVHPSFP